MLTNFTLLLVMVAMTSVASQTFQYSRGWTNGKRDGVKRDDVGLDRILTPCQMHKLKYLLEGKPLNERLLAPCEYLDDDIEVPKRHKVDRNQDPLYDAFL